MRGSRPRSRASEPGDVYARFVEAWGFPRPGAAVRRAPRPARARRLLGRALARRGRRSRSTRSPGRRLPDARRLGRLGGRAAEAQASRGRRFAAVCDVLERRLGAERLIVPGTTHAPQHAGAPFNGPLRDFLAAREPH